MTFGRISGLDKPVSRVCQGTMMLATKDKAWAFELLDAVFDSGINTFDSAHIYGGGVSDQVLGEWVAKRGNRAEVVLLDKGAHHNAERQRVTPEDITSDLTDCLERLGFDMIDIFALHRDDESQPVGPIIEELNKHVSNGTIHAIGASNWSHARIREANAYADNHGLRGFTVSSPHYSLAIQLEDPWGNSVTLTGDAGREARDYYRSVEIPLFPWSSLAGGFFSGRFARGNVDTFTDARDTRCVRCYCDERNFERLDRAHTLADERGVSVAQIALAWVLTDPIECFPLTAAWAPAEAVQNAAAVDIALTKEERSWLSLDREDRN
jgi:aryl-alcohol dehydrogenase-like predicted oxidoreductase